MLLTLGNAGRDEAAEHALSEELGQTTVWSFGCRRPRSLAEAEPEYGISTGSSFDGRNNIRLVGYSNGSIRFSGCRLRAGSQISSGPVCEPRTSRPGPSARRANLLVDEPRLGYR